LFPSEEEATEFQFTGGEEAQTTQVNPEFVLVQICPPLDTAATSLTPSDEEATALQLCDPELVRAVHVSPGGAAETVAAADDEGVSVADAELIAELELEAEVVAAAEDEGAAVDVAMPDEELKAEGVAQFADDEGVRVADAELGGVSVADAELGGVSVADAELTAELELEADGSADADDEDDALEVCDALLVKLGVGEGVGLADGTIARFDGGEPAATASAMEKGRPTHALNAAETAVKVEV